MASTWCQCRMRAKRWNRPTCSCLAAEDEDDRDRGGGGPGRPRRPRWRQRPLCARPARRPAPATPDPAGPPAILDRDAVAVGDTGFAQTPPKLAHQIGNRSVLRHDPFLDQSDQRLHRSKLRSQHDKARVRIGRQTLIRIARNDLQQLLDPIPPLCGRNAELGQMRS
jgi:hypothetical protein